MQIAELLKPRCPSEEYEIPGVGTITVRGLTRLEAINMQGMKGVATQERFMLVCGLVDPILTEADAAAWQRNSPAGELEPVTNLITRLSGMGPGADKEAYKSLPSQSDDGVRILPGTEAGPDSGGTPQLPIE